ncbi:MAG: PRC-barrel domain-containing protein, partial [Candidatus Saccharimonadales bacterium]
MLQLSGSLLNRPVLSLQTGGVIATTVSAIINPNNLKIEGFYCISPLDRKKMAILLYQDIRDVMVQGFVVNDGEVLVEPEELVRLQDTLKIHFDAIGKQVVTTNKEKIGKVIDYAADTNTMYIQKLYLAQSMFKNLTGGNLGIDRTQIVEITDRRIIVQDLSARVPARAGAV